VTFHPPHFVVFEGVDGSGKSTQAEIFAERVDAVLTRQPGGTDVGAAVRRIVLSESGEVSDRAEALLMAADRAQHVDELIRPTLASGRHVVSDRYIGSSVAYQGHGRGLGPDPIRELSLWATDGLQPDLVVLLDLADDEAVGRTGAPRDRIEAAGHPFRQRVREGFLAEAARDPHRWVVVDGSGTVDAVAGRVWSAARERLGHLGPA
jgi:dTMP kinase